MQELIGEGNPERGPGLVDDPGLTEGMSNAEIAEKLVIGHETVKTHVKRICMKTGARDRTQAVVWAFQTGFVGTT
jgi:DNA-binding NarL/FixJ family response regulator